jgi:HEAT repeat protein
MNEAEIEKLLEIAAAWQKTVDECCQAIDALIELEDKSLIGRIFNLTVSVHDEIKIRANKEVEKLTEEEKLDLYIQKLDDLNESVGIEAAKRLGATKNPVVIKPLMDKIKREPDSHVSHFAIQALDAFKDDVVVEFLIDIMLDEQSEDRIPAIWSLRNIGDERAIKPLFKTIYDQHPFVAGHSITALATLAGKQASQELIKLLDIKYTQGIWEHKDVAGLIRSEAARGLGIIRQTEALPKLKYLAENDHTIWGRGNKVSSFAKRAIRQIEAQQFNQGGED